MFWLYLAVAIVAAVAALALVLTWYIRWLGRREPYGAFLRLNTRRKITFFRLLLFDKEKRVPFYIKFIPVALVIYLSVPFDIIPDFVPVLGYLDDVAIALLALVLIIKLLPQGVAQELIDQAAGVDEPRPSAE
ncbi:MAG: DUF1232 domain-containing protein [Chloroflexi bacterium]|nr:DUF1232 domain-containing protein [Chloroflexota bacterium]MDA1272189.1 DUF1232 domain-containing protein [Chloroflexota bacterium]PKB58885.1 MAG: hypothetical protein BZY83_04710 [SAR202 cluster bacterium Casp-Chloro-G2]